MTPVTVKELLMGGERLGITQVAELLGSLSPVRHVFTDLTAGDGQGGRPPFPHTVMIFSPALPNGGISAGRNSRLSPLLSRNISCVAVAEAQGIPDFFRQFSERAGTPVFSSRYDASLLGSRLIGLIMERGGRRTMAHGVLVQVLGLGVLIRGESGIGKTACSLDLVERGGIWVADDAVVLEGRGAVLYGRGHEKTRKWIAPRGRGIVRAEVLVGSEAIREEARVDLIVDFVRNSGKDWAVEENGRRSVCRIVGVALPCRRIVAGGDSGQMAGQVMAVAGDLLRSQGGEISDRRPVWGDGKGRAASGI